MNAVISTNSQNIETSKAMCDFVSLQVHRPCYGAKKCIIAKNREKLGFGITCRCFDKGLAK
ncbi:MAG: hypothetical protein NTY50_10965 [Methylobacter sp.]|nr:hypothetical protein [Methylobacter sp.]